jgi:hypothetical protein
MNHVFGTVLKKTPITNCVVVPLPKFPNRFVQIWQHSHQQKTELGSTMNASVCGTPIFSITLVELSEHFWFAICFIVNFDIKTHCCRVICFASWAIELAHIFSPSLPFLI